MHESDFLVIVADSRMWLFEPLTESAKNFTGTDLDVQPHQWLGKKFGVEAKLADKLVTALEEEGFVIEMQ